MRSNRIIIAGSRRVVDMMHVVTAVKNSGWKIGEVVSGCAPGADSLAIAYAETHGLPLRKFPANWKKYGSAAGPIRNVAMAEYAHGLIAVWDWASPGTRHMIETMWEMDKPVFVHRVYY